MAINILAVEYYKMDSTVPRQEVRSQAHADIWQETQVVNVYKVDR